MFWSSLIGAIDPAHSGHFVGSLAAPDTCYGQEEHQGVETQHGQDRMVEKSVCSTDR